MGFHHGQDTDLNFARCVSRKESGKLATVRVPLVASALLLPNPLTTLSYIFVSSFRCPIFSNYTQSIHFIRMPMGSNPDITFPFFPI